MKHLPSIFAASLIAVAPFGLKAQEASPAPVAPPAPVIPPTKVTFTPDGVAHVPAFDLPPSALSSKEAQAFMKFRAAMGSGMPTSEPANVAESRARLAKYLGPQVEMLKKAYPVDVVESTIAGVPVRIVTPHGKAFDPKRVLVNLHGGAFTTCWEQCSLLESIPIAVVGGYKVVSVNYRMAPEAEHPAGVEDAAAVYRDLLKTFPAKKVGIYGCSAGGALSAQIGAWLPAHGLPQPGGLGIFGAGGVRFMAGDSAYIAGYADGSFPAPPKAGEKAPDMTRGYFQHADMNDAVISPALHPDVIAKFPPTLLITGTRAMDMSPAIVTNSALLKAGVRSTLIVGEGMGHCFIYQNQLPEARDAYQVITRFFAENLK